MADNDRPIDELVVNHLLCFLFFYLRKLDIKTLKTHISNYFDGESISAAKDRIYLDIAAVRAENVPHVAKRRGPTDARSKLEIDDIVVLIT